MFPGADFHTIDNGNYFPPSWRSLEDDIVARAAKRGVSMWIGDQANVTFLQHVIAATPGGFDVIIDDGGHSVTQQRNSLMTLWKHVRPGGVYMYVWPRAMPRVDRVRVAVCVCCDG